MTCGSPGAELRGSGASHELGLERSARGVVEERRGANRCVDGELQREIRDAPVVSDNSAVSLSRRWAAAISPFPIPWRFRSP